MKNNKQTFGDLGQHWTPRCAVTLMCSLRKNTGSVFEPSAGSGRFLDAMPDAVGIEIDPLVISPHHAHRCMVGNFFDHTEKYDTIIGNPPYVAGKLLKSKWFGEWHGELSQYANAYLHFIEKAISLLNDFGELIFIVPDSFFSDTSNGKVLRNKMQAEGSFTDVLYCDDIEWDEAKVNVVIFRWQKTVKTNGAVATNRGMRLLTNHNGFMWLTSFEPRGTIGEFFKTGVGSAPYVKDCNKTYGEVYIRGGLVTLVDECDIDKWPRVRHTPKVPKIFIVGGPTRSTSVFCGGDCEKHSDPVMIPKKSFHNIHVVAKILDDWFIKHGTELGLRKYGRWHIGTKQLENCPIDEELRSALLSKLNQS